MPAALARAKRPLSRLAPSPASGPAGGGAVSQCHKARDGRAAFVARLDPDRVKERQLHDAIFSEEWGDRFAVRDYRQDLQQEGFSACHEFPPAGIDFRGAGLVTPWHGER